MKPLLAVGAAGFTFLFWGAQALAQDTVDQPKLNPAEVFTCNYNKGKDKADLDKVIARWNSWSDANNPAPYNAWVLTPVFFGSEITFDVAWLGAWPSYADMGKNLQTWHTKGTKINEAFNAVLSCDSHGSMAVMPMQPLAKDSGAALVRFMDCKVAEGSSMEDSVKAQRTFGKYMDGKGSKTEAWLFFPGMGAGQIDYDYKLVLASDDYSSLAIDGDIISNGGGWSEAGKAFGGNTTCDSARLYHAETVRSSGPR